MENTVDIIISVAILVAATSAVTTSSTPTTPLVGGGALGPFGPAGPTENVDDDEEGQSQCPYDSGTAVAFDLALVCS